MVMESRGHFSIQVGRGKSQKAHHDVKAAAHMETWNSTDLEIN